MLPKHSILGTWKRSLWRKSFKFFTTLCQSPQAPHNYIVSTNISITKYCKNGQLDFARNLFDEMPSRTVVSWNTMISGYSKWWQYYEALKLTSIMHGSNIKLNETTFSTALSVCARSSSVCEGEELHCLILKSGFERFELVGSALLYLYASCIDIEGAKRVFDELHGENELLWSLMLVGYVQCNLMSEALDVFNKMSSRDVVAWTTLISGYARSEDGCEWALELFRRMRGSGEVEPNEFTLDCVIRACGRLGSLREGRIAHGLLIKYGFEFDHSIASALIEFYCDFEAIDEAKRVYDWMGNLGLNASNSLIGGLIFMGRIVDAEIIFGRLVEKSAVSYNLMIRGYAMSGQVEESEKLFNTMTEKTIISLNTMISVYSRNGEIDKALKLFEETKGERNPVTWNSMMSGYIQNHRHEDAFKLYVTMHRLSIDHTRSTFSALFHACTCLGSLQLGELLHAHVIKTPFESNAYVGTSLVDMYSKCGSISNAQKSFCGISSPNVAAWTALINGYAHHGLGSKAILLFEEMLKQGVVPNGATFVGILSACGRAGLVDEGMKFFHLMQKCYGVTPTLEHYACVVDLLGRSGYLQEAEEFIKAMPIEADGVVWGALLSACWFWTKMELIGRVAEKIFNLDPKAVSAHVILSNMHSILGKWGEKMNVRKRLRSLGIKKAPGCSWIELESNVHVFTVEDRTHPHCNVIYATLEHLTSNINSLVQYDFYFGFTSIVEADFFKTKYPC
ncbi:pentatricopeptide repeat-containing protein At2g13600-like [Quercus lobata]|uniref:Pentatricopeptide repeat-containing protein n=1 Tax=Quercus lobata TaxID=97700 RepID=A0A7N2LER0_QUELO|nr:pentatricopeptide repeat-containing protein At2g13600-like [Quercus lobata]XP_030962139.1 pentatricopeptide repeat-containing protein At2g13600-like [Quercus lobata]XP_030962140.1 pentatricopeptide repeat-containing protein At2g13600-like [Quercus lobata]XP_030962141.1 pentatricopeptide repeat-containing protein At2g13600-like [Quercus lobata]XP_030962142.1 pentatricopeptide repeat-containing protein At2g13600-like [Quercus lobata]